MLHRTNRRFESYSIPADIDKTQYQRFTNVTIKLVATKPTSISIRLPSNIGRKLS